MATDQRGLGSPNMDPGKKHEIQSKGGKASHSGGRSSKRAEQYNADIRGFTRSKDENQNEEKKDESKSSGETSRGLGESPDFGDDWED